jgi:hypothetical protein
LSDQPAPLKRQAAKVTGISVVISSLANKIKDPFVKDWILIASPFIGFILNAAYNFGNAHIKFYYWRWVTNQNINDLRKRQEERTCLTLENREIEKEIRALNKDIRKKRSDLIMKL